MIKAEENKIVEIYNREENERPKMMEVRLEQTWQQSFCYALLTEEPTNPHQNRKLLLAIISGNDSTIQATKAAIDLGSEGLAFGYGEKDVADYRFKREYNLFAEKGKYTKFPISIDQNRKAVAIVHESLLGNQDFVLSFDGDPAEDIRQLLGGGNYGLHILPQWKDIIYQTLLERGFVESLDFYYDKGVFTDGFYIFQLKLTEEEADTLISEMILKKLLEFPKEGTGKRLEEISDLPTYLLEHTDNMVSKLSNEIKPTHDPMSDEAYPYFDEYERPLFPVQAHVATAIAKRLKEQKALLLQGEMSTGKSAMLTAIADAFNKEKRRKGFFACLMVPPSLTKKWPEEIREVIPNAKVHVITKTEQLIRYHTEWTNAGRRKPRKPTFFVISFTTMRGDCAIEPAITYQRKELTPQDTEEGIAYYKDGFYCPDCGQAHQLVESTSIEMTEEGEEITAEDKRVMKEEEWGTSRRIHDANGRYANAFCSECGTSLWTKRTPTRYESFLDWTSHEKKVTHAAVEGNQRLVKHLQVSQEEIPKKKGNPRRIATIEYIRRKMKNFFDITLVDEIHELKSGMTAQGNSLGSLAAVSKKIVGATGTLFGGKAEDVYYLLWRLFPTLMADNGFTYSNVRTWNEEYGNIETTTVTFDSNGEYSNKQSRGGTKRTEKVLPGISPFVFGKFLVQNAVLVRLVDVWPDPVELVNVPTILVPMDEELQSNYRAMVSTFESEIDKRKDGNKLYLPLTQNGIAYPDNPFTYPDIHYKNEKGERELIWKALHLSPDRLLNKEKKLQEIIKGEMEEARPSIVYVRDTGSSVKGRDVRPRLKEVLEQIGAKVAILDTTTTATNTRSEWVKKKIEQEGYDVIIVSQELVKVGLDLLCTPTLLFYQFSWSLFTINQAARRAWRIAQNRECRLFYIAYKDCYQEQMAQLIALKNKATSAINGEVSSDGLSAMLGDDGDLQSMLIQSIKKGNTLAGSTEEWVNESSDRARELLQGVGKNKKPISIDEQFKVWVTRNIKTESTRNVLLQQIPKIIDRIEKGDTPGFYIEGSVLHVDLIEAFGFDMVADGAILAHLVKGDSKPIVMNDDQFELSIFEVERKKKNKRKQEPVVGQLGFDLF